MKADRRRKFLLVLLFLLPLAVDFPALRAGFAFDDLHSISRNPHLRSLENIPRFFVDPTCFSGIPRNAMYRPFLLTTYALDFAVAGLSPWFWHLTNLLLHGAMGVLVFFLLLRFLPGAASGLSSSPAGKGNGVWTGFAGALLFEIHPLNVEVLGHVSSRSDLLMGLLLLGALLAACRAVEGDEGRPRVLPLFGSLVLFTAALLTKEPAVLFPLGALPFLLLAQGRKRPIQEKIRKAGKVILPGFLLAGAYLALRKHLLGAAAASLPAWTGGTDSLSGGGRDMVTQLSTQAVALGKGVGLLFFPWKLSADHWIPLQHSFLSWEVLAGIAMVLFFTWGVLLLSRPRGPALAGLSWAALLLAPSILIPLNQIFAEHRLYAAGPGLALALSAAFSNLRGKWAAAGARPLAAWARPGILGLAVLLLGGRSFLRCRDWRDRETLWRATIATDPGSYRAWAQLGQALGERGDEEGALASFGRAHALYPCNPGIAVNLVEYLVRKGTREREPGLCREALQLARLQVRRTPWKALPRVKLCRCLLALSFLERDEGIARAGVEAAESVLSFTAPLDRTWAVWAAALDTAGEGEAARALWKWGDRVLPKWGRTSRMARADLLLRLGRPGEARKALGNLREAGRDPEIRGLLHRIQISGTSPGGSSRSPAASPPRR